MIRSWANTSTEDVFHDRATKAARKLCPANLVIIARRKLDYLEAAHQLSDLKAPPGNRLEPLAGKRKGQNSIRINDQVRIVFTWKTDGPYDVEICDYH